ncbi:START domain-containing protein, partial [Akkermansiaceae bacterium]|nr:START domain-containing protein [Akkermansiaceae bacterium]
MNIGKEGWMRKHGSRVNIWGDRYFVLRGQTLHYYLKPTDTEPKGFYTLLSTCKVSDISSDEYKKKKQYVFRLSWPPANSTKIDDIGVNVNSKEKKEKSSLWDRFWGSSDKKNKEKGGDSSSSKSKSNQDSPSSSSSSGNGNGTSPAAPPPPAASNGNGNGSGSGGSSGTKAFVDNDRHLILACDTYHDAQMWVHAIDSQLIELQGQVPGATLSLSSSTTYIANSNANAGTGASVSASASGINSMHISNTKRPNGNKKYEKKYAPPPGIRIREVENWIRNTHWDLHKIIDGVRILSPRYAACGSGTGTVPSSSSKSRSDVNGATNSNSKSGWNHDDDNDNSNNNNGDGGSSSGNGNDQQGKDESLPLPCLRINMPVKGTPEQALNNILELTNANLSGPIQSIRLVEKMEPYLDVIHVLLDSISMELSPIKTGTSPRDLCLMRYWRQNDDGSYIICLDSTLHHDCPIIENYVRADLHAAYIISGP